MGEVFITRKGGGGKATAPTIAITEVGGTWIELEITNNDAAPSGATIFVLANYDPTSETDFDLQASQNGYVFAVAEGATVTQLVTGLDPDTSHTVSASAAVIKKLPSSIVTTDTINLAGTGITAPTVGPIVSNSTNISNQNTTVISVTNNDTQIPLVIKANFTTSTTPPATYPFETASLAVNATTNLTLTGLTGNTTYYIHARAFDGEFSSSNVVFGPFTTPLAPLYDFTTATFTNGGQTGRTGPNITQARNGVSNPAWANTYLNMNTTGYQLWTVPISGDYTFSIAGAKGGNGSGGQGGRGASFTVLRTLNIGQILTLIVGQRGTSGSISGQTGGGGGGGSFVFDGTSCLIAAGGGGGNGSRSAGVDGQPYNQPSGAAGEPTGGSLRGGFGGTGGGGGAGSPSNGGSGGAGINGNGLQGAAYAGGPGLRFSSGFTGGNSTNYSGSFSGSPVGGFGGGAGVGFHSGFEVNTGGAGGYSGGGGSGHFNSGSGSNSGGGGGSFIGNSTYISTQSLNSGDGFITITKTN